jgi:hypothetical protein
MVQGQRIPIPGQKWADFNDEIHKLFRATGDAIYSKTFSRSNF